MSDFLAEMAKSSAARADSIKRAFSDDALDRPVLPLRLEGFDIVAEVKNRSPAEGELSTPGDHCERATTYAQAGAAAISVLTEPDRFAGSLEHLEEVVASVGNTPVMRKDFIVDKRQVLEARAAGASGILLIAGMLDDAPLTSLLDCALEHGLFVLFESFDRADVAQTGRLLEVGRFAEALGDKRILLGVNTRNLRTLAVDFERLVDYRPLLPKRAITVAESGLHTPEDAARAAASGYDLALIGTALMRAEDPAAQLSEMLEAGRKACLSL